MQSLLDQVVEADAREVLRAAAAAHVSGLSGRPPVMPVGAMSPVTSTMEAGDGSVPLRQQSPGSGELVSTAVAGAVVPAAANDAVGTVDANAAVGASDVDAALQVHVTAAEAGALVATQHQGVVLLREKKQWRRSSVINDLVPKGGMSLPRSYPQRADPRFGGEGQEGDARHAAEMRLMMIDFAGSHVQARHWNMKVRNVGIFGDWLERNKYGKYVDWQPGESEHVLVPVDVDGTVRVPHDAAVVEYVLAMATGNAQSRPKGYFAEYRNGPMYRTVFYGQKQGDMLKGKVGAYGYGAFSELTCATPALGGDRVATMSSLSLLALPLLSLGDVQYTPASGRKFIQDGAELALTQSAGDLLGLQRSRATLLMGYQLPLARVGYDIYAADSRPTIYPLCPAIGYALGRAGVSAFLRLRDTTFCGQLPGEWEVRQRAQEFVETPAGGALNRVRKRILALLNSLNTVSLIALNIARVYVLDGIDEQGGVQALLANPLRKRADDPWLGQMYAATQSGAVRYEKISK